jgi:hypothetical protein
MSYSAMEPAPTTELWLVLRNISTLFTLLAEYAPDNFRRAQGYKMRAKAPERRLENTEWSADDPLRRTAGNPGANSRLPSPLCHSVLTEWGSDYLISRMISVVIGFDANVMIDRGMSRERPNRHWTVRHFQHRNLSPTSRSCAWIPLSDDGPTTAGYAQRLDYQS